MPRGDKSAYTLAVMKIQRQDSFGLRNPMRDLDYKEIGTERSIIQGSQCALPRSRR